MTRAVVLDAEALNLLQQAPELPNDWTENFDVPAGHPDLVCLKRNDINYIFRKATESDSPRSSYKASRCEIIFRY